MRTLRLSSAGTVILALVGGLSLAVAALPDDEEAVPPPTEFSGRLSCEGGRYEEGAMDPVWLGRFEEGSVIRREVRDDFQQQTVDEMSDPRLNGTWSVYMNSDEYIYIGTDFEPRPGLGTIVVRIENDDGAWQGFREEVSLPGEPVPERGVVVQSGEGAYEGLTAVVVINRVDEPCGIEVRGYIIKGEMPPVPAVGA